MFHVIYVVGGFFFSVYVVRFPTLAHIFFFVFCHRMHWRLAGAYNINVIYNKHNAARNRTQQANRKQHDFSQQRRMENHVSVIQTHTHTPLIYMKRLRREKKKGKKQKKTNTFLMRKLDGKWSRRVESCLNRYIWCVCMWTFIYASFQMLVLVCFFFSSFLAYQRNKIKTPT